MSEGIKKFDELFLKDKPDETKIFEKPEEESFAYDERVVVFFDVLGMKNRIIKEKNPKKIFGIMVQIKKLINMYLSEQIESEQIQYFQLSDAYILVADKSEINLLLEKLAHIQWLMLSSLNVVVRGAITFGDVSVEPDSKVVIGSAFINAYTLESKNAIFPRVMLDKCIVDILVTNDHIPDFVKEDCDNIYFIDYIAYAKDKIYTRADYFADNIKKNKIVEFIAEEYETDNLFVKQKYGWLVSKFQFHSVKVV